MNRAGEWRLRLRLLAGLAILGTWLLPALANATSTYRTEEIPPPVGVSSPEFELEGISCPAVGSCVAVGHILVNGKPVIATYSAGAWGQMVPVDTPDESGDQINKTGQLTGVSCPATGSCVAVGYYGEGRPMVVEENGGIWGAATEISAPAGAEEAYLAGVACLTASSCVAVGNYEPTTGGRRAMIVTESGGVWGTGVGISEPTGSTFSLLDDVKCPATGSCVAVGGYQTASSASLMALAETGGTWGQAIEVPAPSESGSPLFGSLSCPSVGSCVAFGNTYSGNELPVMSAENGGTWATASEAPLPSGAIDGFVGGVSCAASGSCLAVGGYWAGEEHPWVRSQTTGTWGQAEGIPAGASLQEAQAEAVDCPAIGSCMVVGTSNAYTKALAFIEEPGGEEEPHGGETPGSGGSETPSTGGSSSSGGSSSPPAPSPTPAPPVKPKPLVCRKGFKKQKVHSKTKCVKVKKKRHRH